MTLHSNGRQIHSRQQLLPESTRDGNVAEERKRINEKSDKKTKSNTPRFSRLSVCPLKSKSSLNQRTEKTSSQFPTGRLETCCTCSGHSPVGAVTAGGAAKVKKIIIKKSAAFH